MQSTDTFLGLDASTQALKASLLSSTLDVLSEIEVRFDRDLPQYGTRGGVLYGPEGSGEVFSPVMILVEAMDLLMDKIKGAGWDVAAIRGVSAAGQVRVETTQALIPATCICLLVQKRLCGPRLSLARRPDAHAIDDRVLAGHRAKLARLVDGRRMHCDRDPLGLGRRSG
jgi:hypothetical protein